MGLELQYAIANKFSICRFSISPFGCLSLFEKTYLSQDKVVFFKRQHSPQKAIIKKASIRRTGFIPIQP